MIRKLVGVVFALGLLASAGWLGNMVADRSAPVAGAMIKVNSLHKIIPGMIVQVEASIVYTREDCHGQIDREIYDHLGHRFVLRSLPVHPVGIGPQNSTTDIPVSVDAATGDAALVSHPRYWCNPFQYYFWPISVPDRVAHFYVFPQPSGADGDGY